MNKSKKRYKITTIIEEKKDSFEENNLSFIFTKLNFIVWQNYRLFCDGKISFRIWDKRRKRDIIFKKSNIIRNQIL